MNEPHKVKTLVWVGSSLKTVRAFPADVKDVIGYALYQAQQGLKASFAKPLRGFGGAGVLEISDDYQGDTYRAVYTVQFAELVYVLHAFKKKSKRGIATPQSDLYLIEKRLKAAEEDYRTRQRTHGISR